MAAITAQQVAAAYEVGRDWLNGAISRSNAIKTLSDQYGLNPVSAGDMLQVLKAMLAGERFTRSISAPAADIYLNRLSVEGDPLVMKSAIVALDKHIEYYEGIRPVTLQKLRNTCDTWRTWPVDRTIEEIDAELQKQVATMLAAPAAKRQKGLPPPGTKPNVSYAKVKVFHRSAAVVAEVILRANGKCETCKQPAPFLRARDGRPYLEVHHKKKLADGGEDTVENAVAVCPNCHRFHHYGE